MIKGRKQKSLAISPYGKADFVTRRNPETGEREEVCLSRYNVEFSETGCIFQVPVSQLEEVLGNFGSYSPEHTKLYRKTKKWPNARCDYCYAWKNIGNIYPKKVNERTRADFEKFKPEIIRLGKLTECGHPYYYKTLMDFLDLCDEFYAKLIFITKALPFGIEGTEGLHPLVRKLAEEVGMANGEYIADRLRRRNASLFYSIGWDKKERGAVGQGFTNKWRIRQARDFKQSRAYLNQGANVSLNVAADVTSSIQENIDRGNSIGSALESGVNIRIIPLRPNRGVAEDLCGCCWKDILGGGVTKSFMEIGKPVYATSPYRKKTTQESVPDYFHPDFQELYEQGIGFCGIIGENEHCDKCKLDGYNGRIRFPVSQLVPVDYQARRGKSYGKKKQCKGQKKLFK